MAYFENKRTTEISAEVYKRSLACWHRIADEDKWEVFTETELCGYGVYTTYTYAKADTDGAMHYYCDYTLGNTCD